MTYNVSKFRLKSLSLMILTSTLTLCAISGVGFGFLDMNIWILIFGCG